jgi:predicted O-linked N-acetylglucosamine transferase (SPINDLY family)
MHMDRNRLLVFARKTAPVQVTWLAYPGTTGLTTMDYRLSDPHLDPPGAEQFYVEKTVRLPDSFWCYDPLATGPAVSPLPALAAGHVTFGCLNNFAKVTEVTLEIWAKVLSRIADSRLILLAPGGSARRRVLGALARNGVAADRIEFIERQSRPDYLQTYHRIDLCLDTTPYTGHTTSLDSLWMGVPPITLAGVTAVSRGGLSLLSNLGLERLVAKTADEFVELASQISVDKDALNELRLGLRDRMEKSPLMDAPRFARNIESVYRQIWAVWCRHG